MNTLLDQDKKWIIDMRVDGMSYKEIKKALENRGIKMGIRAISRIVWAETGKEVEIVRKNIGCDHNGNYCDCINNTGSRYADYLRKAGLRAPNKKDFDFRSNLISN